jgi:hypothetical protein
MTRYGLISVTGVQPFGIENSLDRRYWWRRCCTTAHL